MSSKVVISKEADEEEVDGFTKYFNRNAMRPAIGTESKTVGYPFESCTKRGSDPTGATVHPECILYSAMQSESEYGPTYGGIRI
jgi:hypothetical protein